MERTLRPLPAAHVKQAARLTASAFLHSPSYCFIFEGLTEAARFDALAAYEQHLADFAARYRRRRGNSSAPVRARLVWLSSAANHVYDDDLECDPSPSRPNSVGRLLSWEVAYRFTCEISPRMH